MGLFWLQRQFVDILRQELLALKQSTVAQYEAARLLTKWDNQKGLGTAEMAGVLR